MAENKRGIRNWIILAAVGLLTISGLALAQEDTTDIQAAEEDVEEDAGPPWLRESFVGDWTPGTPGPPPWAGQDDEDDGQGPPWLRPDFEGNWTPGTPGPPPWAGQEGKDGQGPKWLREGFEGDWTPGTPGPPPWAGQDDDEG